MSERVMRMSVEGGAVGQAGVAHGVALVHVADLGRDVEYGCALAFGAALGQMERNKYDSADASALWEEVGEHEV